MNQLVSAGRAALGVHDGVEMRAVHLGSSNLNRFIYRPQRSLKGNADEACHCAMPRPRNGISFFASPILASADLE